MFPAALSAMAGVRAFTAAFCYDAGVESPPALRLELILEELFTNTVKHGHLGDCAGPVWIALEGEPAAITLTYLDQAPPFNPLACVERTAVEGCVETRRIGGLGVLLVTELSATCEYAYVYGRNRLRMVLLR